MSSVPSFLRSQHRGSLSRIFLLALTGALLAGCVVYDGPGYYHAYAPYPQPYGYYYHPHHDGYYGYYR